MKSTLQVAFAISALVLASSFANAGADIVSAPMSCAVKAPNGANYCLEIPTEKLNEEAIAGFTADCQKQAGAVFTRSACSTTDRVGTCTVTVPEITYKVLFYPPFTVESGKQVCTENNGTFTNN
ncbi:MAG: hypothetical protein AABY64_05365 [Bdellovibrionota bacterium]